MSVQGIDYFYLETHNWGKAAKFWRELGFTLTLDLGTSGLFSAADGGPGLFLEEVPEDRPLSLQVYLRVGQDHSDGEFTPSHWGTQVAPVRDPDGREFILQKQPPPAEQ